MRKNLQFVFSLAAVVLLLSAMSFAQEERRISAGGSKYVISAEAGGVNYVEGKVMVVRGNETSGYLLKGDSVKVGEEIETGADGKTEILLNPGSYARLGGNSSFEFIDNSLEDLQIKLNRGSAIFEVLTTDDFTFTIKTPKASFNVVRSGVYRVDVLRDGTGKLEVFKGRVQVGEGKEGRVKKGRAVTVDGDDVAIEKFDRDEKDSLEEWSKSRSKELSRANSRLERSRLRSSLISSFGANRWNLYDSFGVWVFDSFRGGYVFLPFGYGWASPYGYRYRRDLWYCRLPRYIYYTPPPRRNPTRNSDDPNSPIKRTSQRRSQPRTRVTPPYRRADNPNRSSKPTFNPGMRRASPRIIVPRRSSNPQKRGKGN